MASSVITVIQPGGSGGSKYNLRASGLRYFPLSNSATPADGYIGGNSTTAYKITCADITELWSGLTFVVEMPSTPTVANPTLQINSLTAKPIALTNGATPLSLVAGAKYVVVYDGTSFLVSNAEQVGHASTTIGSGSYTIPDGNAVYEYVTNTVTNRWSYVISDSAATTPQGAEFYNGTTTVIGTLPASSATEYKIYLVRHQHTNIGTNTGTNNQDYYDEWITVKTGTSTYKWEKIGNTDIDTDAIASDITDNIIDSIAPHSYVKPTGSGSVSLGSHTHTFNGDSMTSTGSITPNGSISVGGDSGTSYTPAGTISTNASSGLEYAPAGTVLSTFTGTDKYVKFNGTQATITMSTSNVVTGNQSDNGVSLSLEKTAQSGSGWSSVTLDATASASGSSSISTNTDTVGTHTHSIPNLTGSVTVDGSSFTVSTQGDTAINVSATTGNTVADATFTVPIASASVTTQPAYSSNEVGTHTHIGTLPQFTTSGTLSSAGTASNYSVSNEVLTLTPSTTPSTSVSMTIATQSLSIENAGGHSHNITQSTQAEISVTGGQVKIIGTTAAHKHTLSGSASPAVSVTGGTTGEGGSHKHSVSFSGSNIASLISVSVGTLWAKGTTANHTHTVSSLTLSTAYTPAGSLADGTSTDYNVKPSGSVASEFTGTSTKFAFSGTATKIGFNGSSTAVSVTGTTTGSIAETSLGDKTVTVNTDTGTLNHTVNNQ